MFAHQFPIAIADGLIAFVFPEEAAGGGGWLEEVEAFDGFSRFRVGEGAEGGKDVEDVGGGVFPGAGGDAARVTAFDESFLLLAGICLPAIVAAWFMEPRARK